MEKLDVDFERDDYYEIDDVLDRSFFSQNDDLEDLEEDESYYDVDSDNHRPISEF